MTKQHLLIFILIIIQPIIDIITSLTTEYSEMSLSVGAVVKTGIMAFLFVYIFRYLLIRKGILLGMYIGSFACIMFMVLINIMLKENYSLFGEINFALKTSYYVVMIYIAIILIRNKTIHKTLFYQAAKIMALIIAISYWVAILTKTDINSYTYVKVGYSGWFFSANELSVTVVILLGLTMMNLSYERKLTSWVAFIFIVSMLPMIGTKTAFLGGGLLLFSYGVYLLFKHNINLFNDKTSLLFFAVIVLFVCFIPFTPIASNTKEMDLGAKQQVEKVEVPEQTTTDHSFMGKILSSRNMYFQDIKEDFVKANGMRKSFGLGFAGDYTGEPKIIEMDFFDLFFSYGIIGTLFLLMPLVYLIRKIITFPLSIEKIILLLTLGLCFGIAFLAGHVLFAPSVMTYVAILFLALGLKNNGEKYGH